MVIRSSWWISTVQLVMGISWALILSSANASGQGAGRGDGLGTEDEVVKIPLRQGTVQWNDLLRTAGHYWDLDFDWIERSSSSASSLKPFAPGALQFGQAVLSTGVPAEWLSHFSLATDGTVRVEEADQAGAVTVDVERMRQTWRARSLAFRDWYAKELQHEPARMEIVDETWKDGEPTKVVVLLHGFHSAADGARAMALGIHASLGLRCVIAHYPNDAPIEESSQRFAEQMKKFFAPYPKASVSIVAHSMGGLVSRSALESGSLDPIRIERFIQVCTPNHGSELADYAGPLEWIEQLYRARQSEKDGLGRAAAALLDGLGEAKHDLRSDSAFLKKLNSNPRHPQVQYTLIAGTAGPLRGLGAGLLSAFWDRARRELPELRVADERITRLLECDELRRGRGDGIVSVQSVRLEGVSDFVTLDCTHLSWGKLQTKEGEAILEVLVKRLGPSGAIEP